MKESVPKPAKTLSPETTSHSDSERVSQSGKEIMQAVLSRPRHTDKSIDTNTPRIDAVVIGTFAGMDENDCPMVHFDGCPDGEPLAAISTTRLTDFDSGHEVAISFIEGDPCRPIILGIIEEPKSRRSFAHPHQESNPDLNVTLDGENVTLSAEKEITLKCGKSSITLTRAGKIIIKGEYLSNHSTGVNRIKGGSVQIN